MLYISFLTNNYSRHGKNPLRLVLSISMLRKQLLTVLLHTIYFYSYETISKISLFRAALFCRKQFASSNWSWGTLP